jgi:SAM-dependent methyltransferase
MERNRTGELNIVKDLVSQILKNLLMGSAAFRRWRLKRPRSAAAHTNTDEFLQNYAFASLNLLLEHAGGVLGKTVCEIGPGDHLTSGLSILAAGASRYCVIDRFPGDYFGEPAKRWYREIGSNWGRFYPELPWNDVIDASKFPNSSRDQLELIGEPLESARPSEKYDLVCSFQVGEHISDIDAFANIHNEVLKPGGVGLHRVDFGPHDCWFYYRDPGVFLRFSDKVWQLTGSNRGVPNRKRHHEFLEAFDRAGLNVEVLFTDDFNRSLMDLERLNKKFLQMPLESVLTGTAIYKITKQ